MVDAAGAAGADGGGAGAAGADGGGAGAVVEAAGAGGVAGAVVDAAGAGGVAAVVDSGGVAGAGAGADAVTPGSSGPAVGAAGGGGSSATARAWPAASTVAPWRSWAMAGFAFRRATAAAAVTSPSTRPRPRPWSRTSPATGPAACDGSLTVSMPSRLVARSGTPIISIRLFRVGPAPPAWPSPQGDVGPTGALRAGQTARRSAKFGRTRKPGSVRRSLTASMILRIRRRRGVRPRPRGR